MLILPIKKKWFDMIICGKKEEEYREIKPYYRTRFRNAGLMDGKETVIRFRNGYSSESPFFDTVCSLSIGWGKEEWGAEKGKLYYVLKIKEQRLHEDWANRCGRPQFPTGSYYMLNVKSRLLPTGALNKTNISKEEKYEKKTVL